MKSLLDQIEQGTFIILVSSDRAIDQPYIGILGRIVSRKMWSIGIHFDFLNETQYWDRVCFNGHTGRSWELL
jgi:hypothetical protein